MQYLAKIEFQFLSNEERMNEVIPQRVGNSFKKFTEISENEK